VPVRKKKKLTDPWLGLCSKAGWREGFLGIFNGALGTEDERLCRWKDCPRTRHSQRKRAKERDRGQERANGSERGRRENEEERKRTKEGVGYWRCRTLRQQTACKAYSRS
jgi:hypothetical protein